MKNITSYEFFKQLTTLSYIDEIWLYGSRARQDNKERSDIDLAIVCPTATHDQWIDILEIIDEADTLLQIDCVRFDTLKKETLFKEEILRDKVVLYSKIKE